MLKRIFLSLVLIVILFAVSSSVVEAKSVRVSGYTKRNGIYVNSYYRTSPNRVKYDNYSAKGNYNVYTGKRGTVSWWR